VSAYEAAKDTMYAASRGMTEARRDFDTAMNRGDHQRAQDAANEMATCAIAMGHAAAALESYFAELRGVA